VVEDHDERCTCQAPVPYRFRIADAGAEGDQADRAGHAGAVREGRRCLAHWTPVPVHVARRVDDPATGPTRGASMKSGIHPDYVETTVTCTCGATFTTRSTAKNGIIHADVCSQCHPFYTGKQKILDTGGRVAKFQQRYGKRVSGK
jgi:large subunit ribosomal protein L31